MKREKTSVIYKCDLCRKRVDSFASVSEGTPVVYRLVVSMYYGDTRITDVCDKCNKKLKDLIKKYEISEKNRSGKNK